MYFDQTTLSSPEDCSTYYGDVIQAVTALRDISSMRALMRCLNTGNMAATVVASFGDASLSEALNMLPAADAQTRHSLFRLFSQMTEQRKLNNHNCYDSTMRPNKPKLVSIFFIMMLICESVFAQSLSPEDRLNQLLSLAEHSESDRWAAYLIDADSQAVLMERKVAGGCCGFRCSRVHGFTLTFLWNEAAGSERYQHDLLKLVVRSRPGTKAGVRALEALLKPGCGPLASEWLPYFRVVLGILESAPWRQVNDVELTRVRAEAYETWWSLSRAAPSEPLLADNGLKPQDFEIGAQDARSRAITAYEQVVARDPRDKVALEHLASLRAGQDTHQRQWYCFAE